MIIRNVVVRHGRRALATPLQSCLRAMSTETITSTSTITESLPSSSSSSSPSTSTDATAIDFTIQQHVRRTTGTLGSDIAPFYEPRKLVTQPLTPKDVTLELLLASQTHMGHATSLWNPANQRYIYGIRNGIHIISLEATAAHLRRAAKVVEGVARSGGLILFIGTRPGQVRAVVKAAKMSKGCHLFERWIPGTITNGDQILGTGGVKVVDQKDEKVELPGLAERVAEQRALRPDLVVCLNPLENYIALRECGIEGIPTIGIIDTDADPTWVTYPIPANDDSLRSVQLIAGVLGRAGEAGQKARLAKNQLEGADQKPLWRTPQPLAQFTRNFGEAMRAGERNPESGRTAEEELEADLENAPREGDVPSF